MSQGTSGQSTGTRFTCNCSITSSVGMTYGVLGARSHSLCMTDQSGGIASLPTAEVRWRLAAADFRHLGMFRVFDPGPYYVLLLRIIYQIQ